MAGSLLAGVLPWSRGPWSVYRHLVFFGLTLIVPMALLSAAFLRSYEAAERQEIEQRVGQVAIEVARGFEREISGIFTTLEVVVKAPALEQGDLATFIPFVANAAEKKRLGIVLRDNNGRQVFNTLVPDHTGYTPLSSMSAEDRNAIARGTPHVSNLYVGVLRKQPIFVVSVPVKTGVFKGHALNGAVEPANLVQRIDLDQLPRNFGAAIFDRSGQLVSQSSLKGGGAAPADIAKLRSAMTGAQGIVRGHGEGGDELIIAYQRSRLTGWLITASLTGATAEAAMVGSYRSLVLFTLGFVLASIALAAWFGRAIAHPVSLLAERAGNLDQRWPQQPVVSGVTEVNEVMRRLDEAASRLAAGTQELRLSEARYRDLAMSTPAGLFRTDATGRHTFINERWSAITGIEPERAKACNWLDVIHADDRGRVSKAWQEALAKDGKLQAECRIGGPGTAAAWVLLEVIVESGDQGGRIGAVGSLTDLTERKAAEAIRREGEDRLQLALELGHMGTFTWNFEGDHIELDPIAAAIFGRPPGTALSYPDLIAAAHANDADNIAAFKTCLQSGSAPCGLRCRIVRRSDSETRYVAVRAFRQRGAADSRREGRAIGVLFDVTEQTLAERSLEEVNAALERRVQERTAELAAANERLKDEMLQREAAQAALGQSQKLEALGQLTSGVAHDFNNQLMAVLGGLELIEKGIQEPRLLKHAQTARAAARRASQLTDQLLSFSRKGELVPGRIDITDSLAELEGVLRHAVGSRVTRHVDIAPGTEAVWADPDQMHATLLNIAINARDAMPRGGELTISARNVTIDSGRAEPGLAAGRYVAISLADTGIGMGEDVLKRATEPFFTTKPRGRGTGLGLAMASRFAEQSGGALNIVSKPGQGTVVEILLPVAAGRDGVDGVDFDAGAPDFIGHGRVLCVDDDKASAEVLAELLRGLGYDVTLAVDPMQALSAARDMRALDLLVTDVDMPELDGFAVAEAVRHRFPDLPVLYVTGHSEHIERQRARSGGSAHDAVLRKPFSGGDLKARLTNLLQGSAGADDRKPDLVSS